METNGAIGTIVKSSLDLVAALGIAHYMHAYPKSADRVLQRLHNVKQEIACAEIDGRNKAALRACIRRVPKEYGQRATEAHKIG
ncbi:MAG: hypothetical protein KGI97_00210 [Alphaproteobacteria bacterium]|nr:hypothetical protein [Alphaproteobacteria bacterium]